MLWIQDALSRAIDRAQAGVSEAVEDASLPAPADDEEALDRLYSAAIHDIADQLVHELRPLIGSARLHAAEEAGAESRTASDLNNIARVLKAVDELARAASVPAISEFNLPDVLAETVRNEVDLEPHEVQFAGRDPFPVLGDPALLHLVFRNGVRNAVEAVRELKEPDREPVVVSWGASDVEYRLSVLDRGPGVPMPSDGLFRIRHSDKGDGHAGMGLYLAQRAALSLGGGLTLVAEAGGGSLFEFRWPKRS